MITATSTEMKNNFGKYLQLTQEGEEIMITKNGKQIARLTSAEQANASITDSLIGIISGPVDEKALREERMYKHAGISRHKHNN